MNRENEQNLITFPLLPSLFKECLDPVGVYLNGKWVFHSLTPGPFGTSVYGTPSIGVFRVEVIERYVIDVYKRYARIVNRGRPRKVSWSKMNRLQRDRAMVLALTGLL